MPFSPRASTMTLVVAVLLTLALTASATTTMLPFSGNVLMDVETVCRHVDSTTLVSSGNTTVRTLRISGNTNSSNSIYPFYVRELQQEKFGVYQFVNSALLYTTELGWWCTTSTNDNSVNDYTYIWQFLRTWIMNFQATGSGTSDVVRDINTLTWGTSSMSALIPTSFGGDGTQVTASVVTSTAATDWTFNTVAVNATPLTIQLSATSNTASQTLKCDFNFAYFGIDVQDTEMATLPTTCDDTGSEPEITDDTTEDDENPMPSFPPEFTADFQVIMPNKKKIWTMTESYNSYTGSAKASVASVRPDNIGRTTEYEWYVDGSTQMAYFYQSKGVTANKSTISNTALRKYFWPDTESCRRAYIGYGGGEALTSSVLLYSSTVIPSFIGNQTVRNIPCRVWTAIVSGARVTWFWASETNTTIANPSDGFEQTYGTLVRMTVEGTGLSAPLFVHHPFFQKGYAMPERDRFSACYYFGVTDLPGCSDLDGSFFFIYDIMGFVPYRRYADETLPSTCTASNVRTSTYPSYACEMSAGGAATALLMVMVALVCLLLGGCVTWMTLAPTIRTVQEMNVSLAKELLSGQVLREEPGEPNADNNNNSAGTTAVATEAPASADTSANNRRIPSRP